MKPFRPFSGIVYEGEPKTGEEGKCRKLESALSLNENGFAAPQAAFEKYADTVYRLAFVRTKNRHDSDDILQEVFLRYMKVWRTMQSEEHVKAMLIRITVNCSNSLLTSAWFRRTAPLDESIPAAENDSCESALSAVFKLPVKYRTAVYLYYYSGYSVDEMSEILGITPSAVKTRLSRARQRLKTMIKAEDL